MEKEDFRHIILPEYITKDKNLTDKEKSIYSMILTLSKNKENSKEILKRILTPINNYVNTYRTRPINTDLKIY